MSRLCLRKVGKGFVVVTLDGAEHFNIAIGEGGAKVGTLDTTTMSTDCGLHPGQQVSQLGA